MPAPGFGPLFLFVVLVNEAWWIRCIMIVGLWVSFAISYVLLALAKRVLGIPHRGLTRRCTGPRPQNLYCDSKGRRHGPGQ
jgi:hypothetical protein